MKHILAVVGKPKAAYVAAGLADYAKRLGPYGGLEIRAVRAERAAKNRAPRELMTAEAGRLLALPAARDLVWCLDPRGQAWDSEAWAAALGKAALESRPRLIVMVGGHLGLAEAVRERAEVVLSLGPVTLPHELAALVAAEQLYRAHTILAGLPYHRA
ncbi:MAG: 23S rRNA (pseudouridine(1915)-N(3))-methyltransferase RlmH [Deltaproteobacteria bacterium]|nr:23S rRNA (pseudouridine(1915)-N(3))-methyltransferase RlmH [Deltaproteobacteria bacterium]